MPPALTASVPAAPVATPVSQETRLAYVLHHFRLVYEAVPEVGIGFAGAQTAIEVLDGAADFFGQATPYPAAPNWRSWLDQRVPFFFDAAPHAPLLTFTQGHVIINSDVISAAFYLLSGWQEYFSIERDRHGRFPYAASVQQQYSFVTVPVVNYYFDVLKTALEHVTGQKLHVRSWGEGAPFAAFITHDIDNLRSAWKAPAKAALQQGQLAKFGRLWWQHLAKPDAWDNLEAVAAVVAEYGAKSTFFILPASQPGADGTPNADYQLDAVLWERLHNISEKYKSEIGLHGSIGTAVSGTQFACEAEDFLMARSIFPFGNRFHYLRWEPRLTPQVLSMGTDEDYTAPKYDSTLGFAEHFGFRNSYCHPFYPFNFVTGETHTFLEIPLNVMDATLHHPNYLQLRAEQILPALQPMFSEVERFGGVATLLWHNDHFDPFNTVTGPKQFRQLMSHLQQQKAVFLTGWEIWRQFLC
ncbi:MAG TPA: hypothetical protein VF629_08555 [Hymenobacter sp.]|jgi:hypothetical protein|uniref:DUF7033 domain-containing protein n=1 Tax=Hymenobacter sp. TaxID=1898978 RepID=UPI002EDB4A1F